MSMTADGPKAKAMGYIARGWFVHKLLPSKKEPGTDNGYKDAVGTAAEVERMWATMAMGNIGIATGASGLVVVDVDMNPWKNKQGKATWDAHVAKHGHVDTFTVRTWSGGLHYYYLNPQGVPSSQGSSTKGLGVDIDTRGTTGYVVAAGSRVVDGEHTGTYEIEHDIPLAECPQWIVDALAKPEAPQRERTGEMAPTEEVEARVRALSEEIAAIPYGEAGEETVNRNAFMAGQYVGAGQIEEFDAIRILLDGIAGWTWVNPADEAKFQQKIMRGVSDGTAKPHAWEPARKASDVYDKYEQVTEDFDPLTDTTEKDAEEEAERLSMWGTDNGQGVYLRDRVGDMAYAVGVGWLLWDGKRWAPVPVEFIQQRCSRFYRAQFGKALDKYKASMDMKSFDLANAFKSFMSANRLTSILASLKVTDGVLVRVEALDSHPDLLNTQNGIVDLRTGEISPHKKSMMFTKITKAEYRPGYKHVDWEEAQKALPVDVAEFMKLRLGQAITGRIPESDDFIYMQGGGSNAKSVWANEGVLFALGDYGKLAQPTLVTKVAEGATPERAGLRGCRYVVIEELPEGKALSIAEIKRIVGTATITARNLYEKEFTFAASHSLFITTNFMPVVSETDEGSWRRMCKVVFPYEYVTGEPQGEFERKADGDLKPRIKAGLQGQHEAILAWLVEGAIAYYADPSRIMLNARPQSVKDDTLAWRKEADRILAFVEERMVMDPSATVIKQEVFDDFTAFLETHGNSKWSMTSFMAKLTGHKQFTSNRCRVSRIRTATVEVTRPPLPAGTTYSSAQRPLAAQESVIQGMRFRTEADDL